MRVCIFCELLYAFALLVCSNNKHLSAFELRRISLNGKCEKITLRAAALRFAQHQ